MDLLLCIRQDKGNINKRFTNMAAQWLANIVN